MTNNSMTDKARLARIAADRAKRAATGRLRRSRLYRWRFMGPPASHLLFLPQEIRTADPTFFAELKDGHLGFAGFVAHIGNGSPFDVVPPSDVWLDRLNGFAWLRHLAVAREEGGDAKARTLVLDWIKRNRSGEGRAFLPAVMARRLISWLANGSLLLDAGDQLTYDTIMQSLEEQTRVLAGAWAEAPAGLPRLTALTALMLSGLCIADQEQLLDHVEGSFLAQLDRQIGPTGHHVSRDPSAPVEILLDLLPMTQCFVARERDQPKALLSAIKRMLRSVRAMRLGDGQLARFHGRGPMLPASIATVLAYDDAYAVQPAAPQSGYMRLVAGQSIVIVDTGAPPALEYSGEAHAGCLAFELSSGTWPLIVNSGAPGAAEQGWREVARSTAAHSTLSIDGHSSSHLVSGRALERTMGTPGITGPEEVTCSLNTSAGIAVLEASHDGYLGRFGLLHRRLMRIEPSGARIDGCDRLGHPDSNVRIRGDVPFAIHFHVHPEVACSLGESPDSAILTLPSGERWKLSMKGSARLGLEESIYLADATGPRRSIQITLRGRCLDSAEVHWRLERITYVEGGPRWRRHPEVT
jgi:uncharacterized heparinase superfamily protein